MTMDNFDAYQFFITHKWWFAALTPIVIAIIVVKLLNPN